MSAHVIPLYQKVPEKVIRHSLNNTIKVIDDLEIKLNEKGYHFLRNQTIGRYHFNFYCPQLKIAIEIDGYAHEFLEIYNQDAPKKLCISSLGITVFRFTDHQILVDIDEVLRALKNQIKSASTVYVV
ncbi:endonuclease domain-containing protein [Aquimarina sp. AU474]|uniref:endonuclease domain-containing protein n=1 Tax=Aquimarina sp. AU474 TaxID=2108529 RepID=UPI000D69E0F5|nr:DUF559 domain-containing protein [Aquimarina sp. AU474]